MRYEMNLLTRSLTLITLLLVATYGFAQRTTEEEAAYTKTINERADKIVKTLNIADEARALRVRDIIAGQYRKLSEIHDAGDLRIKAVRENATLSDDRKKEDVKAIENETELRLTELHTAYLTSLLGELTSDQVDQVKNGMTYNVLTVTYKGYQDMLPNLTGAQKKQIMEWLVEAREHAMDAGSSEKKHWWFGKYKGRINNYLAAAGYDLKKAGADWEARRKSGGEKK